MRFLYDQVEFGYYWKVVEETLVTGAPLHKGVFRSPPFKTFFTKFSYFMGYELFSDIQAFTKKIGEQEIVITTIVPPPSYFYSKFRRFQTILASWKDTTNDYLSSIEESPGPIDTYALKYRTEQAAIFSQSRRWFAYGDHSFDIFAIGIFDPTIVRDFSSSAKECHLISYDELARFIHRWTKISINDDEFQRAYNPAECKKG